MAPIKFLIKLSESEKTDFGREDFSDHSYPQKVFTAVFGSCGSIAMDGFAGYFTNSDGESAHFAAEAYRAIGATHSAAHMERACALVSKDPIPQEEEARHQLIDGLPKKVFDALNALDDEWYKITEDEPYDLLLLAFVRKHPDEFGKVADKVKAKKVS